MLRCRLAVDEAPRLERRLLRVAPAPDHDPVVLRPLGRLLLRVGPQDVVKEVLERLVELELALDLSQERLGYGPVEREDRRRLFRVGEDVLHRLAVGDDRRLVMLAGPQVKVLVRVFLDLAAPIVQPVAVKVVAVALVIQEIEEVRPAQVAHDLALEGTAVTGHPAPCAGVTQHRCILPVGLAPSPFHGPSRSRCPGISPQAQARGHACG